MTGALAYPDEAAALCRVARLFGERRWCVATSGNFSVRVDASHCLITQSGKDKADLSPEDLMVCDLDGNAADADAMPSAETPVHAMFYRLEAGIGSVLHTHSVTSTVLSRTLGDELVISGFEMQKALAGVASHEDEIRLAVFENSQDLPALADEVASAWQAGRFSVPGLLIRGHGVYAWGRDLAAAQRHIEGLEFLLECVWQEKLAKSR